MQKHVKLVDLVKSFYEYEYDDQIVCAKVEKSLFGKKIEKKEGKAYNKQGASKRPNVEVEKLRKKSRFHLLTGASKKRCKYPCWSAGS